MHQFHTKSSFGNACKQFALCAILDPSTFVAQPLLTLAYVVAFILFSMHGLLLDGPVLMLCTVSVLLLMVYASLPALRVVCCALIRRHRTVTIDGDMLFLDVLESGNHYEEKLEDITIAVVRPWGMRIYYQDMAVVIWPEEGADYAAVAERVRTVSKEKTQKFQRSQLPSLIVRLICTFCLLYTVFTTL